MAGCGPVPRVLPPPPEKPSRGGTIEVATGEQLMQALQKPLPGTRIVLVPGRYELRPTAATEARCGNCERPDTEVSMTVGLQISGRDLTIEGPRAGAATIVTHAGYGLYFRDCHDCRLERVSVTGGVRDADANATDGAIVVADSRVQIWFCHLYDNIGSGQQLQQTVVGIAGIVGRQGADLAVRHSRIIRNSWDGIALYRNARATIMDNVIDGVDKARGMTAGGGRGVGIGVTHDAKASISNNLVTRYWKGIGIFMNAGVAVRSNFITDIITWGIAYWAAGEGRPVAAIEYNAIHGTGACGVSIHGGREHAARPGSLLGNLLSTTGQDPRYDGPDDYCRQRPVDRRAVPEGFRIADNLYHQNRFADGEPPAPYVSPPTHRRRLRDLCQTFIQIRGFLESSIAPLCVSDHRSADPPPSVR